MIAEESLGHGIDARSPQLQQKILRPRNPAEHDRPRRNILRSDPAPHPPNHLARERKRFRRSAAGQHHGIGPPQRSQRLAQASRRKQTIARIVRRHQHDIEIAGQSAMLKPIIQQMNLRTELRLGEAPSLVAIFPHHHRRLQPSSNQQRLIAEIPRQPAGIDQQHSASLAPVTARKHIEIRFRAPSTTRPAE